MTNKVWINGKIVDSDKARISIFDRGFLYGDGVFETMRAYAGCVFKIDEHLDRLYKSLKISKIKAPYAKEYIRRLIYKMLKVNKLDHAYIRVTITRGQGRFAIDANDVLKPFVIIVAKDFQPYSDKIFNKGIRCSIVHIKQNELSPLSGIKSLNYMNNIMARFEAQGKGLDEAILTNSRGFITEASTSNIFIVRKKTLITPSIDSGILPGITRAEILKIARRLKILVKEKLVSPSELVSADEVFLTNSLAEVLPVISIGSNKISSGLPGLITKSIHTSYQKEVIRKVLGRQGQR